MEDAKSVRLGDIVKRVLTCQSAPYRGRQTVCAVHRSTQVTQLLRVKCALGPVALAVILVTDAVVRGEQAGGVDQRKAEEYFAEARAICERDNGRLWGVSLCGPMVIVDAATATIATNQPAPSAPWPPALGFANAAMAWGGTRWSTFVWALIPPDPHTRARLWMHELFHRVQPQLGLLVQDGQNEHLDTVSGRYWMQLEWRALGRALRAQGTARLSALKDAAAFRAVRRTEFADATERERAMEINEGLAQYTGTVLAASSRTVATADAIEQLAQAEKPPTIVRSFPYPTGAAYGVLLDEFSPGWRRTIKSSDDFGVMLYGAAGVQPAGDLQAAAARYDGPALKAAEEARARAREAVIEALRKRFVSGPVLILPGYRTASSSSAGGIAMTPIPGVGMVMPSFRTTAEWGSLEAEQVLVAPDRSRLTLPAPADVDGQRITGSGYKLVLAPEWMIRPGPREGDFEVVKR
jgi:hypothetical protein